MTPLSEFIYYRTYARWLEKAGRRETWIETVDRYVCYMRENLASRLSETEYALVRDAILRLEVMPSMRLLWSAGAAAKTSHCSAYNCAYVAPASLDDFAEIMYLLMCGTGVGFSVEDQCVRQLPTVKPQTGARLSTHAIPDSKIGWCDAIKLALATWYGGKDIDFDFSQVRPAGARLHTMGGRASGPEPMKALLRFARERILANQGRRLSSLDVHDLVCKIGEVVVMGGVRRSALISLSDLGDKAMRGAKAGTFYLTHPERSVANNSAVYTEKPTPAAFHEEWQELIKGGTGERGIFNRGGLPHQLPKRRWDEFEPFFATCGTNPCGEIVLRSKQFCNLSEVIARPEDTLETLLSKVKVAAIIGTYQSTLTDFPYLSKEWRQNCEAERLLGVSITGHWDAPVVREAETLRRLKAHAVEVNQTYAKRFGVNSSRAVTCVKPSGTVSLLVDAAPGMHPRYAPYYIRRIRVSASDPLLALMKDQGFAVVPEVGQTPSNAATWVLEFPVKAPAGSICRGDLRAQDQLEYWLAVKKNYTEHNPSVTVHVRSEEWEGIEKWLLAHWDLVGGLTFLPKDNHVYQLAPYEEISQDEYEARAKKLPKIDFSKLSIYEAQGPVTESPPIACEGPSCEVDPEEGSRVRTTHLSGSAPK